VLSSEDSLLSKHHNNKGTLVVLIVGTTRAVDGPIEGSMELLDSLTRSRCAVLKLHNDSVEFYTDLEPCQRQGVSEGVTHLL
jgi:hypothetical protein